MRHMAFHHYRLHLSATHSVFPLRLLTLNFSRYVSRSPKLSYWHRPHTSKKFMPLLFVHGIGIGLQIYTGFLRTLIAKLDAECEDGQIGILALEIMPLSFRITSTLPSREDMVHHIRTILDSHGWTDFVVVAHSFGSIFATHLLRSLRATCPVHMHPLILVDPVTLSIHLAEIPYNFIYRKPRTASQLMCSFAATDMGVAHCITRMFDWTQNVLWLDELEDRPVTVILAGIDCIIDTDKLRRYLAKFGFGSHANGSLKDGPSAIEEVNGGGTRRKAHDLDLVNYKDYNHGEIFLREEGRGALAEIIFRRCQRQPCLEHKE
jgi:pimeloyl-ACP methyl ester carboxylesterase